MLFLHVEKILYRFFLYFFRCKILVNTESDYFDLRSLLVEAANYIVNFGVASILHIYSSVRKRR